VNETKKMKFVMFVAMFVMMVIGPGVRAVCRYQNDGTVLKCSSYFSVNRFEVIPKEKAEKIVKIELTALRSPGLCQRKDLPRLQVVM
jgi:hypothetical protein